MYVAVICTDKPDSLQIRLDTRPTHLEYLRGFEQRGKVAGGGPLLGPDGKPNGTLILLDVADIAEAHEFAAGDPYAAAGLFENVDIRQWNWLFNPPTATA